MAADVSLGDQYSAETFRQAELLVLRPTRVRVVVALAIMLLPAAIAWQPAIARADPPDDSAVEMLQDAYDALADSEHELARKILRQLIVSFPGTPEAIRAEHELAELNSRQDYGGGFGAVALFGQRSKEPQLRRDFALSVGDRVFFAQNSAAIGGRARVMIDNQARWLKQRPELKVTIIGRADDDQPAESALMISSKRAEAVRERLITAGIEAARISVEARGAADPVATCASAICRAQNRHAETWIGELRGIGALGDRASRVPAAQLDGAVLRGNAGSVGSVALPR